MQHSFCASYNNVMVRQIQEKDLEFLRIWRNDSSNSRYLNPIPYITQEMQQKWYKDYLNDDTILTFGIVETELFNRLVGSVSIYDFSGGESNCGKTMIGDAEARGHGLGFWGEVIALHIGFQKLGIKKYITDVHEDNAASQKMTARLGFQKIGNHSFVNGGFQDDFEMSYERFYSVHPYLLDVSVCE